MTREIDVARLEPDKAYKLLVGAVQPRPIAWLSTVAPDGTANLAPFSFFTVASRNPATVLVSIGQHGAGAVKDTLHNVRTTGEFVVNVASMEHLDAVSATSAAVAADVDEFHLAALTTAPSITVRPPRVAEARLALECRLREEVRIGTDTVVFGTVLWAHSADGVLDDGLRVDNDVLQPLGRLAGPWFADRLAALPQPAAPEVVTTRD
ncbi:flavin reductase family protein [Mycolicibacterium palauense]|uniref:flavin reductase family protein n=1 Tax=Mycolicibacterium palauense TaxID=2034511 RepID=UPI001FE4F869|nr:flavin reductase family protein [Mycolicibacterium palauense]